MTKDEFRQLLEAALELAAGQAEQRIGRSIPRTFQFLLYGGGYSGKLLDLPAAADILYLGEDKYYRIIDLAVIKVSREFTLVFARISGHEPGTFAQTWNDPPGYGPFKLMIAKRIEVAEI